MLNVERMNMRYEMTIHLLRKICILCMLGVLLVCVNGCTAKHEDDKRRQFYNELIVGVKAIDHGRKADALKAFDRAVTLDRSNLDNYEAVAQVLMAKHMSEEGLSYLVRAVDSPGAKGVSSNLKVSELYREMGDLLITLRKIDDAERAYANAVRLYPQNALAYNNWGYNYAERGIQLDEALRLTKRAVELSPSEGMFVDSLGWAYFQKHQYKESVDWLKKAVRLDPTSTELRYHLGMAYEKTGYPSGARVEYSKALALYPSFAPAHMQLKGIRK